MRRTADMVRVIGVAAALALVGCSGGDPSGEGPTTTIAATVVATTLPTSPVEPTGPDGTPGDVGASAPSGAGEPTEPPLTTFAVVEVPETGVPGLDSDDSFCAAWSRFGGSWQVIQVAANFAPDPSVVPALEVAAAPVVAVAYDAMFAAWPDELADERAVVADGFFGPLDRRAETALAALVDAGATEEDLASLRTAWEGALASRAPDEPVVTPVLDDGLRTLVDEAADRLTEQLVDFVDDPSMRIVADTPRTDAYLATACPDQGALTGGEVDGG